MVIWSQQNSENFSCIWGEHLIASSLITPGKQLGCSGEIMEQPLEDSDTLVSARTHIEKVMLQLDPNATEEEHKMYLAGYVDALNDTGQISDEEHDILYAEYAL